MPSQQHPSSVGGISWLQLIAYGLGGIIPIALFNSAGQLIQLLGNISLGLSAVWLGVIMIIPRLWDAVSDPIVGHLSDNARTRWGRRRPFILVGGLAVAVSFAALWWMPKGDWIRNLIESDEAYNWFQLTYLLVALIFFFTACTLFEIPHGALGMELANDYHQRTRLFSAKSFLGNLFAMGTPWLIWLANLEFFRGTSVNTAEGMRNVSLLIAAILVPLSYWWFSILKEPSFQMVKQQRRSHFWTDMRIAGTNRAFLCLVGAIFTLAMGFNFVALFNSYITIFYLYDGDIDAAGWLLGVMGTVWAVTALVSVVPLNVLSERYGKRFTLLVAIALMCGAQLAKIVCYDPSRPYLILIPTVLLSSGMLMFFTLGASMVGDICDEDELHTGTRTEGAYYSVYWWFIKMGSAFASFVTGLLLVYTSFDERQNITADSILGHIASLRSAAEQWPADNAPIADRSREFNEHAAELADDLAQLNERLEGRIDEGAVYAEHIRDLIAHLNSFRDRLARLANDRARLIADPTQLIEETEELAHAATQLKRQAPTTLFRLRLVEIGLPVLISAVSIALALAYPLTEARCYEIKAELESRRAANAQNSKPAE